MKPDLPLALRYLDNLQKEQNRISLRKFEEDEIYRMSLDKRYKSPLQFLIKPEYVEIRNRIPELQSIIHYQILERHKKDFDNLIINKFENSKKYNVSVNVYFGTVISSSLNARIKPIGTGPPHLVILNESIWESLRYISDIAAEPLSLSKSGNFDINWKAAKRNVDRFGELLNRIIMCKHLYGIEMKPNTEKNKMWNSFWDEFHESMESFVFGHEYGHFLRGHNVNNNIPIVKKWAQEYEADRVGLDLSIMQGVQRLSEGAMFTLCGIYLFFKFMIILEWYMGPLTTLGSHPPAIFRYAAFKDACRSQLGYGGLGILDTYISSLSALFDYYDANAQPIILKNTSTVDIKGKIERTVQYSAFWNVMVYRHREIIEYLDKLRANLSNNSNLTRIDEQPPLQVKSILESRKLSYELNLTSFEKLFNSSIRNNFLSLNEALNIIETTKNIYETNMHSLGLGTDTITNIV